MLQPAANSSKEAVISKLKQRGERLTIQRLLVIDALCTLGGHQTVHDIHQHLHQHSTDLTEPTIYRILQWLKDAETVSQTDLGHSGIVYELLGTNRHHHLVCLSCGAVIDVDDSVMASLREHLRQEYGFEPRIDHMAVFGMCRACHNQQ
ncbi:MAG: transcriptional repressor [Anaerolineae bacterium]|nr:transcriptional repressor [Anaerolineae bacterium]